MMTSVCAGVPIRCVVLKSCPRPVLCCHTAHPLAWKWGPRALPKLLGTWNLRTKPPSGRHWATEEQAAREQRASTTPLLCCLRCQPPNLSLTEAKARCDVCYVVCSSPAVNLFASNAKDAATPHDTERTYK